MGRPINCSVEETAVVPGYPEGAPTTSGNIDKGCEVHQLARLQPAEVAVVGTSGPPRIREGVTNQETVVVAEVDPDWTEEAEADVAGRATAKTHWFWELLEAAGYDVW